MSDAAAQITSPAPTRDLLIVEDDNGLQTQMRWAMANDFIVHVAGNRTDALALMERHRPTLAVLDLGLPPDANGATEGLATLDAIVTTYPGTKVVVASGNDERANALKAISLGAHDFFTKP